MEALNSRAAMILAAIVGLIVAAIVAYVLALWGWLVLVNALAFSILGWWAIAVKIAKARHAPVVVYDKKDRPARVVDGQVLERDLFPASLHTLNYHNAPRMIAPPQTPALPAIDAPTALPQAKSIYELAPAMHGADKVLLGYDAQGPIWLEIEDLLSIAMAGNSGRGKSRALLWLILQFLRLCETRVIDGKADLRKWLGAYHPVAYTPGEIQATVDGTIALIEQRLDEDSRGTGTEFPPVLVVLDELDLVTGRYARTTTLVELLTKKSRSVNVHGVYSNQSIPAALVGGIKNRGVIVSRICFYCDDEAAQLIGVRSRNGGTDLLDRIGPPAPQGLALVRTAIFGWRLVAFPFVPDTAIGFLMQGLTPLPPLPMKRSSLSLTVEPALPQKTAAQEERERIQTMIDTHPEWSNARIFQEMEYHNNNKLSLIKSIREERSHA